MMIVERHYDDETLIGLLSSRTADTVRDPHLAICSSCSESLASYRAISAVLGEEEVWALRDLRLEAAPDTVAALRSFVAAAADDEELAAQSLPTLLAAPEVEWLATITATPRIQTPALVAALVSESERVLHKVPLRALALADLAARVGDMLRADAYPRDVVARSRGTAWRQVAYVTFYIGDFPRAMQAIHEAQQALEPCMIAEYDLARVGIVRALVLSAQDHYEEALHEAAGAARVFHAFGDRSRYASARSAEAYSLMSQLRYREALPILEALEADYCADLDNYSRANVLSNIGVCHSLLGDAAAAFQHYQVASAIFEEIGNTTEAARIRYNIAALIALSGRHADAKVRFRAVRDEFARLGMPYMAVSAGLELAELLIAENSFAEAAALCALALSQFEKTGLSTTTAARTALVFLREATAQRRATPETVRHVRKFIERLPKEPTLQFAPPPLRPS